ncbi:MAG: S8/S53 family peptidase [Marmoricola sp.]|nr:S8/S53 family peptidase [Marmoricola sp.]
MTTNLLSTRTRRRSVVVAALALATTLTTTVATTLAASPSHAATSPGSGSTQPVPQGSSVAPLKAGTPQGTTAASTPMDVSIVLRARNVDSLDTKVASGWTGPFLTTAQFAAAYGQTSATVDAIESYLHGFGISTSAYADRLLIHARGTAAQFDQALHVALKNYRVAAPNANGDGGTHTQTVHGTLTDPRVPSGWSDRVLAILGLSSYAPFVSHAAPAPHRAIHRRPAAGSGVPAGMLAPTDFTTRYHLSGLRQQGAAGQGRTLGIVTLASFDPKQAFSFWNTYLGLGEPTSRLTRVKVDGGAGPVSLAAGSDETDLDVQQSGAIAPRAHVRVYEAPNSDTGFADAFFAAASDNTADTVSTSWGESETVMQAGIADQTEDPAALAVYDEVFAELAAQGQSTFASSGDDGAYDAFNDTGTTNLAVDTPASSPYITAAGGTTLPGVQEYAAVDADGNLTGGSVSMNITRERAWSWDYFLPFWRDFGFPDLKSWAEENVAGGGGGYSSAIARPSYQQGIGSFDARRFLSPTKPQQVAPGLTEPTDFTVDLVPGLLTGSAGSGRGLPDISVAADPETGYAVYDASLLGGFAQYGGTSFGSPQLNGAAAVIDSALGHRVGLWNPRAYQLARGTSSPFTALTDSTAYTGPSYLWRTSKAGKKSAVTGEFANDNLFYSGRPGSYWNPATGLGTPNLTAFEQRLAH